MSSQVVPINGLMWNFLWLVHSAMATWAEWALREIEPWPDDLAATPEAVARTMDLLRGALDGMAAPGPPA